MIMCQAPNVARSRWLYGPKGPRVACTHPATYVLIKDRGVILGACCGNHRGWLHNLENHRNTVLIRIKCCAILAAKHFYGLHR